MDFIFEQIIVFTASLIANIFSALAGGGAGLIQFPILLFIGLPFSIALATHKVASVALGIGATARYLKEDIIERKFALFMFLIGLPSVIIGSFLIVNIPDHIATFSLGILTLSLGIYSVFQKKLGQEYTPSNRNAPGYIIGGFIMFLMGVLNGSLTSGTGLLVTMLLVKYYGMDYKRAIAYTLIMVGMFWNGIGGATMALISDIKWEWLPVLLLGSFLGGYIGSHFAILKGNKLIKRCFEVVTILIGIKLLF